MTFSALTLLVGEQKWHLATVPFITKGSSWGS